MPSTPAYQAPSEDGFFWAFAKRFSRYAFKILQMYRYYFFGKRIWDYFMNPITKRGNLLVAGGLGYIGSHIIVELLTEVKHKLGFDKIIIVDNLSNSKQIVFENIKKMPQGRDVHFVNVDLADQKKLKATFKKFKTIGTVLYCTGMPKPSLH
jgi:hypothetical protein